MCCWLSEPVSCIAGLEELCIVADVSQGPHQAPGRCRHCHRRFRLYWRWVRGSLTPLPFQFAELA